MSSGKKRILLLHTGGTLGMTLSGQPDDSARFVDSLRQHAPANFEIADLHVEILFNKDSSNMVPGDWLKVARALSQRMSEWDGFVVTHGTDTMVFTASALSYMLPSPSKPIVMTGSQRPMADAKSDAARNLIAAVEIACEARVKEVTIFFDSYLLRGNRAKKVSIPSFQAFESPNLPPLARVGLRTDYVPAPYPSIESNPDFRIETRVAALALFPGMDIELFYGLIDKGVRGLVLKAFGPGDIPLGEHSVVHLIRALTEKGIPTVICSQALFGAVDLNLYETGRAAATAGAISAGDMTWEAALVKMMVLLGRGYPLGAFRAAFRKNLAGELTEELM